MDFSKNSQSSLEDVFWSCNKFPLIIGKGKDGGERKKGKAEEEERNEEKKRKRGKESGLDGSEGEEKREK